MADHLVFECRVLGVTPLTPAILEIKVEPALLGVETRPETGAERLAVHRVSF
jgi:hypothetical protein